MFLCTSCHGRGCESCDWIHEIGGGFGGSYGPCEGCGKTRDCLDCHCYNHKPKVKTRKKK